MALTWHAVLARLGVPTGDKRIVSETGGASRDLPLPLLYQPQTDDGHGGSVVVGRIESLRIGDGMVTATGSLLVDIPYSVIEQMQAGVIGPSVDLDDLEYVMDDDGNMVITQWRVAGATLVAIPAFAGVSITLDPEPAPLPGDVARPMTAEEGAMIGESFFSLAASAAPEVLPPAEWFARPLLSALTPLTVTPEGRVFGHVAGWETCHVGLPGCVTPPASQSGYSYFHVGEQRTQEGAVLPVGTLTVGGGHADAQLGFRAAADHYDDVGAAVSRVVAYEDEFGIVVAGWMLPDADPVRRDQFMSCPVSGDWRRIGGALEMIAVCAVNTPGFPVPRARVAFSAGAQGTLIGTFCGRPVLGSFADTREVIKDDDARAVWAWQMRSV